MSAESKTVFVGALDPSVSEPQLAAAFAPFGELTCVKIPFNKMCGFVEYTDAAAAAMAIAQMNGVQMGNGRIRCMPGIQKPERAARAPYVGGGGGGGGGGWHPHAAAAGGYAAPAASSYPSPAAAGGWSSSAAAAALPAAAESDPYTVDQDDVRAEPLWPNRGTDLFKRNDAFAASRVDLQMMRVGMQLSSADTSSWLR